MSTAENPIHAGSVKSGSKLTNTNTMTSLEHSMNALPEGNKAVQGFDRINKDERRQRAASTTSSDALNPDILSHILNFIVHHSSSRYPDIPGLLTIGSVCASWRNVAWRLPYFWNFICIPGLPRFKCIDGATSNWAQLLQLCLQDSSRLPLTVALGRTLLRLRELIDPFHDEHTLERVDSLEVYLSPNFATDPSNFSISENSLFMMMTLVVYSDIRHSLCSELTKRLMALSQTRDSSFLIKTVTKYGPAFEVSSRHTTVLILACAPVDQCVQVLLECKNLVEWRC